MDYIFGIQTNLTGLYLMKLFQMLILITVVTINPTALLANTLTKDTAASPTKESTLACQKASLKAYMVQWINFRNAGYTSKYADEQSAAHLFIASILTSSTKTECYNMVDMLRKSAILLNQAKSDFENKTPNLSQLGAITSILPVENKKWVPPLKYEANSVTGEPEIRDCRIDQAINYVLDLRVEQALIDSQTRILKSLKSTHRPPAYLADLRTLHNYTPQSSTCNTLLLQILSQEFTAHHKPNHKTQDL